MESRPTGILIIAFGLFVVIFGLLYYIGALSWFGRLPGDIRFGGDRTRVFIPITSMLLISLVLSFVMYLLRRLF